MKGEETYITFNCLNPGCGRRIRIKRPQHTGVYEVTCPHCHATKRLRLSSEDEIGRKTPGQSREPGSVEAVGASVAMPLSGVQAALPIDNSEKEVITLSEDFLTDTTYVVECPHCRRQRLSIMSKKQGVKNFRVHIAGDALRPKSASLQRF